MYRKKIAMCQAQNGETSEKHIREQSNGFTRRHIHCTYVYVCICMAYDVRTEKKIKKKELKI